MSDYIPRRARNRNDSSDIKALALPSLESADTALTGPFTEPLTELSSGPLPESAGFLTPESLEVDSSLAPTRRRRWPIIIAVILTLIIASGAITYYVLHSQAAEREANRSAAYVLIDESIALIQEGDVQTVSLDAAVNSGVTEANLTERNVLLERVPATIEILDQAEEKAQEALELLTSQEDKELARRVIDSATNHREMLTSGEVLIQNDIKAMNSAVIFGQAWQLIVNADTELRATAELAQSGGYYEIQDAITRNGVVLTNLEQAQVLLTQAAEAYDAVDYEPVSAYLKLKIESVRLAIEADQALFDRNIDTLSVKNAEFAAKDAEVVTAAGLIPTNPLALITNAYDASTADARTRYDSARANAADADAVIREYVGVETQAAG